MQSKFINRPQNQVIEISDSNSMQLSGFNTVATKKTFTFEVSFTGSMDMYSDTETVAKYLNAHEGWFCRCAQPMQVEPLGNNGYVLTVGKFGSFGYEVEPKIGVVLQPPVGRVYQMHTIPIPGYNPPGYDVDYQASMKLSEATVATEAIKKSLFSRQSQLPQLMTQVSWDLSLSVQVEFPQFIYKLSPNLIQSTGDRILGQIVRQISPRLTYKVQQDFHLSHQLPMPPKSSRQLHKANKSEQCAA